MKNLSDMWHVPTIVPVNTSIIEKEFIWIEYWGQHE